MNCKELRERELIEDYVAGTLSGDVMESVEAHYFGCDDCAAYVRECRVAQAALREKAEEIRAERPRTGRALPRWVPALGLAASIAVAAFLYFPRETSLRPTGPDYVLLAKTDPPRYEPMVLRGAGDPADDRFRAAMQAYVRREYSKAAGELRGVVAANGDAAEPRFYLAASDLLSGQTREAIDEFSAVIRMGDRRFVAESRLLLAKALLRESRIDAAKRELVAAAEGQGGVAASARELLLRLQEMEAAQPRRSAW